MSDKPVPSPSSLPAYLQAYVESNPVSADAESMASASMSIPRVSLRAKKFRWIENGEEKFVEPESFVIILSVEPEPGRFVKTYYQGAYNPGDSTPPTCSSSDGVVPDSWVTTKQNDYCATCQWNVFGSAKSRSGGKAKACRDSKRLWLARPDDLEGTVYGMGVPVTSLKALSQFGQTLKQFGAPTAAAIVKMTMDDDESFPTLNFEISGWLKEDLGQLAIGRSTLKDWNGALKPSGPRLGAPAGPATNALPHQSSPPAQTQGAPAQPPAEKEVSGEVVNTSTNVNDALSKWGA
jgi:hypothetical protein